MSLARGSVSGSITRLRVCISPRKPVPRRSVAGSVPVQAQAHTHTHDERVTNYLGNTHSFHRAAN